MKRQILEHKRFKFISGCCPGHDQYPVETYNGKTSKKARSKGIKKEHRVARRISKQNLRALSSVG